MIEARAVVVRVDGTRAWVRLTERAGGCGRCDEPGGCRSTQLTYAFKPPAETFALPNAIGAQAGETVGVRVADGVPLRAALATYGLASGLMVAGAAAGVALSADADAGALAGGGVGLALALLANRILLKSRRWRGGLAMELIRSAPVCGMQEVEKR